MCLYLFMTYCINTDHRGAYDVRGFLFLSCFCRGVGGQRTSLLRLRPFAYDVHTHVNYVLPCCCRGNRSGIAIAVVGHDPVGCFSTTFRLSTPTAARWDSRKSTFVFVCFFFFYSHRVNITAAASILKTFNFSFMFVPSVQRMFYVRV